MQRHLVSPYGRLLSTKQVEIIEVKAESPDSKKCQTSPTGAVNVFPMCQQLCTTVDDLHQQIDELQEQLDSLTSPITTKIGKEYSSSIRQVSYFLQVGYISLFVKGILQAENNLIWTDKEKSDKQNTENLTKIWQGIKKLNGTFTEDKFDVY